ncbi:hypothetical protein GCM10010124_18370 [Pilimelia terevasa]|uniref:TVP38/TMEM64 family membrane protein n=1 Tax=Pilimelia terevasa TaxID=53372 RepID=A0A8J3BPC5_9ACTN|nr:VTT domain-containing protein [Pilimelia terevasa]GGK26100.1 hypothetical protein GCM10010124_18370 [Pilimelia terevasa]
MISRIRRLAAEAGGVPDHVRRRVLCRLLPLLAAVAALGVAATQLPLGEIRTAVSGLGPGAPIVTIVLGAALISVLVPRTAVSMACGALFGTLAGFGCAMAAAMAAAVGTYLLGRWAGRGLLGAKLGGRMHRLDGWLARQGVLAVVVTRLLPLSPYGLVGYAYGTTTVRVRHYLLGTLLGAVPSSISYATLGAAVVSPGSLSPVAAVPAVCGMAISTFAAWHWRRKARAARLAAGRAGGPPRPTPAGRPAAAPRSAPAGRTAPGTRGTPGNRPAPVRGTGPRQPLRGRAAGTAVAPAAAAA